MKYFKNTDLAKLYNVSEKSIRNWIESTQKGKLGLELYEVGDKRYIANLPKNTTMIEQLVQRGKKFKNTRGYKVVTPTEKFYHLYSDKDIYDIISNLDTHREIPHKYSYFDGGATDWDLYTKKMLNDEGTNALKGTLFLFNIAMPYIDVLLNNYKRINVIDIGTGNGMPVKGLLTHLIEKNKLGRYIGIDISPEMLNLAEGNIKEWFGDKVTFEGYTRDIIYDRFEDITLRESLTAKSDEVANIVLFIGGTISNLREPDRVLSNIHDSMGRDDLFIFSKRADTGNSRRYFDFNSQPNIVELSHQERMILDLLGISEDFYAVEQFFDQPASARIIQIRLKVALGIEFNFDGKHKMMELRKDECILLWRARHQSTFSTLEQLNSNDFEPVQATKTPDQEYLMLISKIKTGER